MRGPHIPTAPFTIDCLSRCPHCINFKPTVTKAYRSLKTTYKDAFEMVYVSSDQDQTSFDRYFGSMEWFSVPFTAKDRKDELDRHFKVEGIPTVIMLKRGDDGAFSLMEGGREGRAMLSQPPAKLAEQFEQWCAGGTPAILQLHSAIGELEQSVSLVLMCEHLPPTSTGFKDLLALFEMVHTKCLKRSKDQPKEWLKLKCFVAPAPPREPSRWFRTEAKLPGTQGGKDDLEVVLVENASGAPKVYSMREWCKAGKLTFAAEQLLEDNGRMVGLFLEHFTSLKNPLNTDYARPPICCEFGLTPDVDTQQARIKQDVSADTPCEEAPWLPSLEQVDRGNEEGNMSQPSGDALAAEDARVGSEAPAAQAEGYLAQPPAPPSQTETSAVLEAADQRQHMMISGSALERQEDSMDDHSPAESIEMERLAALKQRLIALLRHSKVGAAPLLTMTKEDDLEALRNQVQDLLEQAQTKLDMTAQISSLKAGPSPHEHEATLPVVEEFRAFRRELQLSLLQNVRLRRITLRAIGVAPQKPKVVAHAEEKLSLRADLVEEEEMKARGQEMRQAARQIMAINLHLLHEIRTEKVLLDRLHAEVRRLAALIRCSEKEWASEEVLHSLAEPVRSICMKLEDEAIPLTSVFEYFGEVLHDVAKRADRCVAGSGEEEVGKIDGPSLSTAHRKESASQEETRLCAHLASLLSQMQKLTDSLHANFGIRAEQWLEREQAREAQEAREQEAVDEKARRERGEEHLFVEDEQDVSERFPLQVLPGDDEALSALVGSTRVAVVIFAGPIGEMQEMGGVSRPHEASRALWLSPATDFISEPAPYYSFCEPKDGVELSTHTSALALMAEQLMHGGLNAEGGFNTWLDVVPVMWRQVEEEPDTQQLPCTWEHVPGMGELAASWGDDRVKLPAAVVFVDGQMERPCHIVSAREVYEVALKKAKAWHAAAAIRGEIYRPVFLSTHHLGKRMTDLLKHTWRQQLDGWGKALDLAQRATIFELGKGSEEDVKRMRAAIEEPDELLNGSACWTWRCGAFAATFAPRALSDCNLEGRPPLMKPHIFRFLSALRGALAEQGPLLTGADVSHSHRLPVQALSRVAAAFRLMGPLLEFEDLLTAAQDPQLFPEALLALQTRIANLQPGETLVYRGGWRNNMHASSLNMIGAVIHVLERDQLSPGYFSLVVCNSGSGWGTKLNEGTKQEKPYESGLEYHEASSESFPTPRVRTAMRIKGIPRHRLLDEGFLAISLSMLSQPRAENTASAVYDVLLPHLAGATLDAPMLDEGQGPFEEVFEGTRAHYLPLLTCLNYLLARPQRNGPGAKVAPGLNAAQRGQVQLAMRFSQLRSLSHELKLLDRHEEAVGLQDSDRRLLLEGLRNTALSLAAAAAPVDSYSLDPSTAAAMRQIAAVIHAGQKPTAEQLAFFNKRRPRACMRLSGIQRLKSELETLEQQVRQLRVPDEEDMEHKALVDPVAEEEGRKKEWSNVATLMPFGGFELLRETRPEHRFKGENMQGATQMFVDVTTPDTHVKEWGEASTAILECADRAEKLLARSACAAHSLVYNQVLSLVEHYFLCVLPVPTPAQVGGAMAAKEADGEADGDGDIDGSSAKAKGEDVAEGGEADDESVEGPYTPRERVHVSVQRDCLRALNDIMLLYVAASKSMWANEDAESEFLRLLTVGSIFAVFDAVLRLQALPAPTHLSAVYAGRAGLGPNSNNPLQFAISLKDFARSSTLVKALEISTLVSYPPILTTRCQLLEYLSWLEKDTWQEGFQTVQLYEWQCEEQKVDRYNFQVTPSEDLLLSHVLLLHGLGDLDMPTPGGTRPMLQAVERKEAAGAWLADGWTNNGVYAPEMAQLRDMAFIVKMMVCDPYSLRESLAIKERGITRPSWLKQATVEPPYPGPRSLHRTRFSSSPHACPHCQTTSFPHVHNPILAGHHLPIGPATHMGGDVGRQSLPSVGPLL